MWNSLSRAIYEKFQNTILNKLVIENVTCSNQRLRARWPLHTTWARLSGLQVRRVLIVAFDSRAVYFELCRCVVRAKCHVIRWFNMKLKVCTRMSCQEPITFYYTIEPITWRFKILTTVFEWFLNPNRVEFYILRKAKYFLYLRIRINSILLFNSSHNILLI